MRSCPATRLDPGGHGGDLGAPARCAHRRKAAVSPKILADGAGAGCGRGLTYAGAAASRIGLPAWPIPDLGAIDRARAVVKSVRLGAGHRRLRPRLPRRAGVADPAPSLRSDRIADARHPRPAVRPRRTRHRYAVRRNQRHRLRRPSRRGRNRRSSACRTRRNTPGAGGRSMRPRTTGSLARATLAS